jgi:hypothetical protein
VLRKRLDGRADQRAQDLQPERHLLADVVMDRVPDGEVEADLVSELVNAAELADHAWLQRVVELAVDEHVKRRPHSGGVLELRHFQGVMRRKIDVVTQHDEALRQRRSG